MRSTRPLLILFLALAQPISTFASVTSETASQFVERVFAEYGNPDQTHLADKQKNFYTPELAGLIRADRHRHPGEICNLDFDPICACQDSGDPGELKIVSIQVTPSASARAKAMVSFTIAGEPRAVTLSLVRTPAGWRIEDVSTVDMPSLRRLLPKTC